MEWKVKFIINTIKKVHFVYVVNVKHIIFLSYIIWDEYFRKILFKKVISEGVDLEIIMFSFGFENPIESFK